MKFVLKLARMRWKKKTRAQQKKLQIAGKVYLILYETEKLAS